MRAICSMSLLILGCTVLILGTTVFTSGQERGAGRGLVAGAFLGGGGYHHASTIAEGAQRGMADVVRSSGAANLMNSEAAINVEQARSMNIDNRLKYADSYFQAKSLNYQARWANKKPFDQQQHVRLTKQGLPDRLSGQRLDPLTGKIRWPLGLTMAELKDGRNRMETLFTSRAEQGYFDLDQYNEVRLTATGMLNTLQKNSSKLTGGQRSEARKFLESLSYEAGHQAG